VPDPLCAGLASDRMCSIAFLGNSEAISPVGPATYVVSFCPFDVPSLGIVVVGDAENNSPPAHPNICRFAGHTFRVNTVDDSSALGP